MAFIVGDAYQGRGIGTFLMGALAVAARIRRRPTLFGAGAGGELPDARDPGPLRRVWHREDLGVVTTVIDVPQPRDLRFSPELVQQIRDVARQVIRAVG